MAGRSRSVFQGGNTVKTYQIIEEETIRAVYEIEVPDDIAAKGEDAIYDYWYNIEEPGMHLIESECIDCDAIECIEVTNDNGKGN